MRHSPQIADRMDDPQDPGPRSAALAEAAAGPDAGLRPLCVDLDGSLIKSDTLFDGVCLFARHHPLEIWRLPMWLAGGRARLKFEVAKRAPLDVANLPYNSELLRYLHEQRIEGRAIYLTTGADAALARRIADHLGIFDGVFASDGATNLTGDKKLANLEARFGAFDYVGNSTADLPLLAKAKEPMVANPTRGLCSELRARRIAVTRTFRDTRPLAGTVFRAIRFHQWAKNILLLLPLVLSHNLKPGPARAVALAFFCFSFMASANYIVNDLLDIESDRRHPAKRRRPFASGDLPVATGAAIAVVLATASIALLPLLPRAFAFWLLLYILSTIAYSLYLKRVALVDVLVLSGLYTLRMLAGGAATGTEISPWLASFACFLFLSLAMVKRFSELESLQQSGAVATHGRGYLVSDLEQIRAFGTASAYAAVLVFSLYITRPDVTGLYKHASRLWLIVPLLIYWLNRIWLLASRGELDDDPVIFAIRDPASLVLGLLVAIVAMWAL